MKFKGQTHPFRMVQMIIRIYKSLKGSITVSPFPTMDIMDDLLVFGGLSWDFWIWISIR